MNSLFDVFNIELVKSSASLGNLTVKKSKTVKKKIITDLEFYRKYEDFSIKIQPSDFFHTLSAAYLNKCYEVSQRKGKFTYICIRCFKPISDYKKLVEDEHSHLLYGPKCYSGIFRRQTNLIYSWEQGIPEYQTRDELQEFECISCGRKFQALAKNVVYCGINPRCCFCCVFNTLKHKGIRCPFEKVYGIMFKLRGC